MHVLSSKTRELENNKINWDTDRFITNCGKVGIFEDNEGGNIFWHAPSGAKWEIDAHSEDTRLFMYGYTAQDGTVFPFQDFWFGRDGIMRAVDFHPDSGGSLKDIHEKLHGNIPINAILNFNNKLWIGGNEEGGNIRLISANGQHHWEMDGCVNHVLRFYHGKESSHPDGVNEIDASFTFDSNDGKFRTYANGQESTIASEDYVINRLRNYLCIGDNFILEKNSLKPNYIQTSAQGKE